MNKQALTQAFEGYENLASAIDITYIIEHESFDNEDSFREYCDERIREYEIIYYTRAVEYLSEHDSSLRDSLEIAGELGYQTESLNSEILATLHAQESLLSDLNEVDLSEVWES